MNSMSKIVGITGHRDLSHSEEAIKETLRQSLTILTKQKNYTKVITGMALGYDLLVAEVCIELDIPFIAALAFSGQELQWSKKQQNRFHNILGCASEIVVTCEGDFANYKYLKRDEWIAEQCDVLLSYWSGKENTGTHYTMKEAIKRNKPVKNIFELVVK